jgi:predicted RNase H-like nuclease
MSKVIQVDDALCHAPAWRDHIHEIHPEVCFYFLNGNRPMVHSKKLSEGRSERLDLLCQQFGECVNDAVAHRRSLARSADDIIDAFVCLWTARRIANGTAVQIPVISLTDSLGLPMKMLA